MAGCGTSVATNEDIEAFFGSDESETDSEGNLLVLLVFCLFGGGILTYSLF